METDVQFEEPTVRYIIGIDLGTTNSAVAFVDLLGQPADRPHPPIQQFAIPQLTGSGEVGQRPVLPSFLYLPGQYDLPVGGAALPWAPDRDFIVGEFAREQGARVPGRLVASAKSWLAHAGVDRTAPILPWGATSEIPKVSPVEASKRYLQHIRESWNAQMAADSQAARLENQLVVLTVPASFDEVARELTLTAARQAGLARVILLEEPLAAFYAWLAQEEAMPEGQPPTQLAAGQLILVCDVGGGTTDFTVVAVLGGEDDLRLNRLAVGEHLMLGGDNMDLALGRHIEIKLFGQAGKLDAQRWHLLVQQCRQAKEALLSTAASDAAVDITVVGSGGKLIGGTLRSSLTQDEVHDLLLNGFLPRVDLTTQLVSLPRAGLTELGLPYAPDAAITRHLARFWQRFAPLLQAETGRSTPYPDFVLFNGGALGPSVVRQRLLTQIGDWFQPLAGAAWSPLELPNPRPELAVAVGAAYFGLARAGEGVRVGSGSPRTYYVAVAVADQSVDKETISAVCLVPRGVEEGFEAQLAEPNFAALTNQPVSFQIYTSSTRLGDQIGDLVCLPLEDVTILPPIRTVLRYGKRGVAQPLPVRLGVRLSEVGTLALWCQAKQSEHRWQLEFDVRQEVESSAQAQTAVATVDQALVAAAQAEIQLTFTRSVIWTSHSPEGLRKRLEAILDLPKEAWPTGLIRKLADTLLSVAAGRTRSFLHEAYWLNLLGFCLRPGFGDPADELRMKEVWKLYLQGLSFANRPPNRSEWWVFWRRVAGGLKTGHQLQIHDQVHPLLPAATAQKKRGKESVSRLGPSEELEVWMALANFEWLATPNKVELGRLLLEKFRKTAPKSQELWALSRFGARTTIYGPLDRLIPSSEAAAWLAALLALPLEKTDAVARALIHLAHYTGDRGRDVPEEVREELLAWLARLPQAAHWRELLLDPDSQRRREEQDWLFGEALPAGLVLAS